MHQALHVAILAATLLGAAGFVLLFLWPLLADSPLPTRVRMALLALVVVGVALLVVEWRFVH